LENGFAVCLLGDLRGNDGFDLKRFCQLDAVAAFDIGFVLRPVGCAGHRSSMWKAKLVFFVKTEEFQHIQAFLSKVLSSRVARWYIFISIWAFLVQL
jgi:hypothetical protein